MKPTLLNFDIDGVIADQVGGFNDYAEARTGERHEATYWTWYDQYPSGDVLFREFINSPAEILKLEPLPGAVEALMMLADAGFIIQYVTHRPPVVRAATQDWLEMHAIDFGPVYCVADKSTVAGELFVDDHAATVRDLLAAGRRAVVFDRPWNAHESWLPRVRNWPEFIFHAASLVIP